MGSNEIAEDPLGIDMRLVDAAGRHDNRRCAAAEVTPFGPVGCAVGSALKTLDKSEYVIEAILDDYGRVIRAVADVLNVGRNCGTNGRKGLRL